MPRWPFLIDAHFPIQENAPLQETACNENAPVFVTTSVRKPHTFFLQHLQHSGRTFTT
jgi:hypothetical protein